MALINLNDLVKGTSKIKKVHSKKLGGDLEIHNISAIETQNAIRTAKKQSREDLQNDLGMTVPELVGKLSENEELRMELDVSYRNYLAKYMVEKQTSGTQTELTAEVLDNIDTETLQHLLDIILDALNKEQNDEDKGEDIKNS